MNRKLLSVFFSALVCSTLGHEHLRAHELNRHHSRSKSLDGIHHARANQQQCSFICPVPQPSPEANATNALRLVFIKETNVFALLNVNLQVAIVFQIGEPIALLANGKTGVSVVINIEKQTVVHFTAGSNKNVWIESEISLIEYLQNLGSLTKVNSWENGKTYTFKTVTKEVQQIVISIIETLDAEIGVRVKVNPAAVISLISVSINSLLDSKDVLRLLLLKLDTTLTIFVGGLGKVVNLVAGLKIIGKQLNGGVQSLITDGINVSLLFAENSGLSDLLNLFLQIGVHVDLTKILGDIIKSPEDLLALAVTLDGGIYYGISGITAVIYSVQLYVAKKISLEALIDILIQVQAVNTHVKITKEVWINVINRYFILAQLQTSQFNTGSSWNTWNKFFQDIKDEKLVLNGINVSAIINIMITTSGTSSLTNIVKILAQLKPACSLNQSIATLYFRLVYFIVSGQGYVFVKALLPDIKISIDLSISTSIIKQILSSVNILQILAYILRGDIIGALTQVPVLGPILTALDEILKVVGLAAEVTVKSALKAVGSIIDDLKDILLFGLGKGGKAPSDNGIAGLSILGGGVSVSIKTTWTSVVSWSSSGSSSSSSQVSIGSTVGGGSSSSRPTASPTSSTGGTSKASSSGTTAASSSSSSPASQVSIGSTVGASSSSSRPTASPTSSTGGTSKASSSGTTASSSSSGSAGGGLGGSGSHSGGISIGGGGSSSGGSSSGGSGSHSGGISIGGDGWSSGGSGAGGSGSHSGGISVGGDGSSSGGGSLGGSGSHSGGSSIGGSGSSSGGSSSGGSGSHSGGISIGGGASNSGGSSWGGSGSHSGGVSIGGGASSSGGAGSAAGGSASHSGGISVGGSGSSGGGTKGSTGSGWSLSNLFG